MADPTSPAPSAIEQIVAASRITGPPRTLAEEVDARLAPAASRPLEPDALGPLPRYNPEDLTPAWRVDGAIVKAPRLPVPPGDLTPAAARRHAAALLGTVQQWLTLADTLEKGGGQREPGGERLRCDHIYAPGAGRGEFRCDLSRGHAGSHGANSSNGPVMWP